jgi:dehydrogenase/reductase SDR family member 7B
MKKLREYFSGKVVWITGASSGIGAALSEKLVDLGARLVVSARNVARLEELRSRFPEAEIRIVPLDLAETASIAAKYDEAIGCFGRIDILINNAGISQRSLLHETKWSVIDRIMRVNFLGGAELATMLLPSMYDRGSGAIVVISSIMGKFATPLRSGYCASKFAIQGFYESLAAEAGTHGVSVTLVIPGWIKTEISRNALTGSGERHGVVDPGMARARGPEKFVPAILEAISRGTFERYVALNGFTRTALFLNRYLPALFRLLVARVGVT